MSQNNRNGQLMRHGVIEPAMHRAQDRGLRRQREMFELALVGVIGVADAARAGQAPDQRVEISGHVAVPAPGAAPP